MSGTQGQAQVDAGGRFTFDGKAVPFAPGQTIGAALWAQGMTALRTTRFAGRPRGMFCGIGVCFDCLVVVDGHPDERACATPASPGMDVRTQDGAGHDPLAD